MLSERWRMILGHREYGSLSAENERKALLLDAVANMPPDITAGELSELLLDIRKSFRRDRAVSLQRAALSAPAASGKESQVLAAALPDPQLARTLLSKPLPDKARREAAAFIDAVVSDIMRDMRLSLTRWTAPSAVSRRPDFPRTIRKSLGSYDAVRRRVSSPEFVYAGRGRPRVPRSLIMLVDRSSSMAGQSLWAAAACAVLSALPFLSVKLIAFTDTVADLTHLCGKPAECLLSMPTAGETDIGGAIEYAQAFIHAPQAATVLILSDFFDGGKSLTDRVSRLLSSGARVFGLCGQGRDGGTVHNAPVISVLRGMGMGFFVLSEDNWIDCVSACVFDG